MGAVTADRISRYTDLIEREQETLTELAVRVAEGASLADVCKAWDVPFGRFAAWLAADPRRQDIYDGALRLRADGAVHETLAIADDQTQDVDHQLRALRIRTRQWAASKWDRRRFGEAVQVEHTGETVVRLTFGERQQPALVGSSAVIEGDGEI